MAEVPFHLMRRGRAAIRAHWTLHLQQRCCERLRCSTTKQAEPSQPPSLLCAFPHQRNLAPGSGPGQLGDEIACFAREPASDLHCKNDEACPAPCPEEFWATAFFPLPGSKECHTVPVSGALPWSSVAHVKC